MRVAVVYAGLVLALTGCVTASEHARDVRAAQEGEQLTVGTVQREVRVGMSGDEVVTALGAPNIVTTGANRTETWIYDRIATDTVYSGSSGGVSALFLGGAIGGAGAVGGGLAPAYGRSAGVVSTSQRTLTVIVRFDENKRVADFAYHQSKF